MRELDAEADREAAAFLRAAVRGLHHAGAAARDHCPAVRRELVRDLARGDVGRVVLGDTCGAEDRDGRDVDLRQEREALLELEPDPADRLRSQTLVGVEEGAVVHQSRVCGM